MSDLQPVVAATWDKPLVDCQGDKRTLMLKLSIPDVQLDESTRQPVDVALIVDRSGSMTGDKIETAKLAVKRALHYLGPRDRAAVVAFDHLIEQVTPLGSVTPDFRATVAQRLQQIESRGSTDLSTGWLSGCYLISEDADPVATRRLSRAILLTDGQANQGITSVDELTCHAAEVRKRGITTTTMGLGEGFDEVLLSSMAEAGGGSFQFIEKSEDLPAFFEAELGRLLGTVASGISLTLHTPEGMKAWLVSSYPNERFERERKVMIGELAGGDECVLIFDIKTSAIPMGSSLLPQMTLRWTNASDGTLGSMDIPCLPLMSAEAATVEACAPASTVTEAATFQRAARLQQEAMQLDRQGRFAESRRRHRDSFDLLGSAPESAERNQRLSEANAYADFSPNAPLPEKAHKESAWKGFERNRGFKEKRNS